ncbi:hypothetical protein GCM10022239_16250 [Leifsonia bigeumensis]|uniref:Uncharacterized protein n=1 Tax=Leifsonella bigeumensis TaxID=433643 RepID=A0ABP7FK92_9MICO
MDEKELFLQSDAALRSVIDRIAPEQLGLAAPAEWSRKQNPTLRDILASHTLDELWVPDMLAGRTIEEVGDRYSGDLLGDDPIASYDRAHDGATAAVDAHLDLDAVAHLSYGDFPVREYLVHISIYRAFQAWLIAKLLGIGYSLPPELVEGLWEHVGPQVDALREMGVFPPEIAVAPDADSETRLLARVGYFVP